MSQAKSLKIGLAIGLLAALGAFFVLFKGSPSKNGADASWQGIWADRLPGWQAVYESDYESEGFASANPLAQSLASTSIPKLKLSTLVTATLLKQSPDGAKTVRFLIAVKNYPDAPFDTLFKTPMPTEFEATFAAAGLLTHVGVSDQFNPMIRSFLREMAYDFQIAWNAREKASRIEDYVVGKIEVIQAELNHDHEKGALEMKAAPNLAPGPSDADTGHLSTGSLGRKTWSQDHDGLVGLETSENWQYEVQGMSLGGQNRRVSYKRNQVKQLSAAELAALQSQPMKETLDLDSLAEQKILLRNMDIRTVGKENVQSIREKLSALPDETAGPTDKELYLLLKSYLRLHPEATAELCQDFLLQQPEDSRKFQLVLDALTYAGTTASQQLMMDVLNEKNFEGKESLSVIASLGLSPTGSAQTLEFLEKALRQNSDADVKTTALLAMGNAGRAWGSTDKKAQEQTFEFLKEGLVSAPDEESKRTHLAALGNLGYLQQLELAKEYIKSPDSRTRVDAMRSLRFCADPDVNAFALATLSMPGSDADLQLASIEVLQKHRISAADSNEIQSIFWTLKDERVLQQILTLVRAQVDPVQSLPFLTKVREEHFNPEVRKFARDIILLQQ